MTKKKKVTKLPPNSPERSWVEFCYFSSRVLYNFVHWLDRNAIRFEVTAKGVIIKEGGDEFLVQASEGLAFSDGYMRTRKLLNDRVPFKYYKT